MKTSKNIKTMILVVTIFIFASTGYSQQIPSGGYQGGTHGNIKVTSWSGTVDNDWSDPGNWCPAVVPGAQDDVVIPVSASIMPEVKTSGLSCKSVTLEPGATLTIKPGYVLTVNGREVE